MDENTALTLAATALGVQSPQPFARGGQKLVARGRTASGEAVVLKVVLIGGSTDPNALERCRREVELLRSLSSPHLVQVRSTLLEIGTPTEAVAWLEEDLDGQDLTSLLGSQRSWNETRSMLEGIGDGLAEMHVHGYVHRDLSPGNVRRTAAGVWKVMDPGFAKHLNRSSITGVWQPGTLGHLSPEHAVLGGRVTPASDVFCLGVLGAQMLTGSLPIPVGVDPNAYRIALLTIQVPSVQLIRGDLTAAQAAIIDVALDRQPARRFLNASELVDAIRRLP